MSTNYIGNSGEADAPVQEMQLNQTSTRFSCRQRGCRKLKQAAINPKIYFGNVFLWEKVGSIDSYGSAGNIGTSASSNVNTDGK